MLTADFPQTGARKLELVKPKLFDLALTLQMIREEIAPHAELLVGNVEVPPQELREESQQRGIRVRDLNGVDGTRALCPEQHASDCV
jgi:hypothetical protein